MNALRKMRLDARLTVDDLARKAGVSPRTISRFEADGTTLYDSTLFSLADVFGISPSALAEALERQDVDGDAATEDVIA